MNELALFSGNGGGILGGKLLGWRTVCAVEQDPYCIAALAQRQNEGFLSPFPIWDDVCTFDGKRWRGIVDVVSGGFPCTDISVAGKGAGIKGKESGLWSEMARIIGEVRPKFAFIENSPMLVTRGLDTVLCDLAQMGFDAKWGCISAAEVGANHKRDRIWIVARNKMANTDNARNRTSQCNFDKIWPKKIKGWKEQSQFEPSRHSKDDVADSDYIRHKKRFVETRNQTDTRQDTQGKWRADSKIIGRQSDDGRDQEKSRINEDLPGSRNDCSSELTSARGICNVHEAANLNQGIGGKNQDKKNNNRTLVSERQKGIQLSKRRGLEENKTTFEGFKVRPRNDIHTNKRVANQEADVANTGCEYGRKGNSGELDKDKTIRATGTIHTQSGSQGFCEDVANTDSNRGSTRLSGQDKGQKRNAKEFEYRGNRQFRGQTENWWSAEPNVGRVVNGMAFRVDRLKGIGNGQVPEVVRIAWEILSKWD